MTPLSDREALQLEVAIAATAELRRLGESISAMAELRREAVLNLRKTMTYRQIGGLLGISGPAVNQIINGKTYRSERRKVQS